MNVQELLKQAGGLRSIAKELGISQAQASAGAEALIPAIVGGLKKQSAKGGAGLGDLLQSLGGAALADNVLSDRPTDINQGNAILGSIFGSKELSRAVAADASKKSGLDIATLKKMLPMLTMLLSGYLAKKTSNAAAGGGLLDGLGGMLGKALGGGPKSAAGGLGGLLSSLDADGDGNPLDDILARL